MVIFFLGVLLLGLGQIRFWDEYIKVGQELELHVNVVNDRHHDIDDVRVKVHIFGLTRLTSNTFDIDDHDSVGLWFHYRIPYDTKKGDYLVKITASNDDFKDIEYRHITIV